jgi:adenosylmethionine-8-amino-7-oxononanoate aminotransferase
MTLLEKDSRYVWHPYTQMKTAAPPLPIVRGEGALMFAEDGKTYIDAVSSWWVNLHGHGHPHIAGRIAAQAHTLEQVIFAGFTHAPAVELAEQLLQILPGNQAKVFYSDNGSTAVEVALKIAIQYYHNQNSLRKTIIAFENGYHGDTFGAMSASGELSFNTAFEDYLFEVKRIPPPLPGQEKTSFKALQHILNTHQVCAFIFEPLVMGAGGMLMYEAKALDDLIQQAQLQGVICIADEVMTGFGRTGKLFASHYLHQQPDIFCLSKGLTGGFLPMGVTTCSQAIFDAFYSEDKTKTFFHGHSYTANPLGCAAALASLELLQHEDCQVNIQRIIKLHQDFKKKIQSHPNLQNVRQTGTILALEFKTAEKTSYFNNLRDRLYHFFIENAVLLRPLGNVIYVLPPYCITGAQLKRVYEAIEAALNLVMKKE